ncbi:PAS domain-containing protein [Yoonia sp. MH D7]
MTTTLTFPLAARRACDPKHPVLASLEEYWQSLRKDDGVPRRADVDPGAIDSALPHTFVLERVAPGVARMRVAGQKLHEIMRMEPRGMPISAFFAADDRSTLAVYLESAFAEPALVAIPVHIPSGLLRTKVRGAMLLLPMLDDHGDVSRVLGALVVDGKLTARSSRLQTDDSQPMRMEPLKSYVPAPVVKRPDSFTRPALRLIVNDTYVATDA